MLSSLKKTFILLCIGHSGFIFSAPPKVPLKPQISVIFEGQTSEIKKNDTTFSFSNSTLSRAFKIEQCNENVVANFFKDFELRKKQYVPMPKSLMGERALILKEKGVVTSNINPISQFGYWLRRLPSEVDILFFKAQLVCNKRQK
ncbi:MAG: hypothetical protein ACOYL6_16830 [Bacteriovoracaceae bacterium]